MPSFEELKEKAKDALETIADVSAEAYKAASEKAKVLAKTAKLNSEISRNKSLVRRTYGEIGSKYYELHKDAPGEEFEQSCTEITEALSRIEEIQKEIEALKNSGVISDDDLSDCVPDDDVDVEVEIVVEDRSDANPDDNE